MGTFDLVSGAEQDSSTKDLTYYTYLNAIVKKI
jgi:hypothetical protein